MSDAAEELAVSIAGELTVSSDPGRSMKAWRERAGISQARLARQMGVSPSVLSDYENGRRKSPGALFIKRYVDALTSLDREGGRVLASRPAQVEPGAILGIGEYSEPARAREVADALQARILAGEEQLERHIFGYTVVDSIRTIYSLSGLEFYRIYGKSTERVLVFTQVGLGRSPLVAIRVSQLKPRMVVIHGLSQVDPLAVQLARRERIILGVSTMGTAEQVCSKLASLDGAKA
jgi:putative transcriptional regulator